MTTVFGVNLIIQKCSLAVPCHLFSSGKAREPRGNYIQDENWKSASVKMSEEDAKLGVATEIFVFVKDKKSV